MKLNKNFLLKFIGSMQSFHDLNFKMYYNVIFESKKEVLLIT